MVHSDSRARVKTPIASLRLVISRMKRWIRDAWDDLGDERVAALLGILSTEVRAMNRMGMPFRLANAATGEEEAWANVRWDQWLRGADLDHWRLRSWPTGWGKPWLRETE